MASGERSKTELSIAVSPDFHDVVVFQAFLRVNQGLTDRILKWEAARRGRPRAVTGSTAMAWTGREFQGRSQMLNFIPRIE